MERYNLGTHRGLFQAGLETRKITLSGLEGTSYRHKAFKLIVQMYNSSSYRIIRTVLPVGHGYLLKYVLLLLPLMRFTLVEQRAQPCSATEYFFFFNRNKMRGFEKVVASKLPQGLFV